MTPPGASYPVASDTAGREILQALARRFRVRRDLQSLLPVTWMDTFDWRLYQDGGRLSARPGNGGWDLLWEALDGGVRQSLRVEKVPVFVHEFPAGDFRHHLEPVIEMRRLLPLVKTELLRESLQILDARSRVVARVDLEEGIASSFDDSGTKSPVPPRIRLEPRGGDPEDFGRIVAFVETELGIHPERTDPLRLALAAIGKEPGSYSSKPRITLHPGMRADEAAKTILRNLLRSIRINEDGARRRLDTEFLHDFRVAVRRTRTALAQIKGVFPDEIVEHFRREFAWLGSITGPTRDLDVYLLKIPEYEALLPSALRADLAPLAALLRQRQKAQQARLAEELVSVRYRALIHFWTRFLNVRSPAHTSLANARRPIAAVATERIARRWKRVIRLGAGIGARTPAETLHRLRIECKKLRYLLEFFHSLYESGDLAAVVRQLKKLQDNLGDFNDLQVQQEDLKRFARQMYDDRTATAETLLVMGRLVEQLKDRQIRERQQVQRRLSRFGGRKNRERMRRLLAGGAGDRV